MVKDIQYECATPAVQRRHIISTVDGVQYGGGYAVGMCHIFRTVESMEYGPVTSSVQRQVCNTGLPKLLRRLLVVVFIWEK